MSLIRFNVTGNKNNIAFILIARKKFCLYHVSKINLIINNNNNNKILNIFVITIISVSTGFAIILVSIGFTFVASDIRILVTDVSIS